jgi:hypothetical protein
MSARANGFQSVHCSSRNRDGAGRGARDERRASFDTAAPLVSLGYDRTFSALPPIAAAGDPRWFQPGGGWRKSGSIVASAASSFRLASRLISVESPSCGGRGGGAATRDGHGLWHVNAGPRSGDFWLCARRRQLAYWRAGNALLDACSRCGAARATSGTPTGGSGGARTYAGTSSIRARVPAETGPGPSPCG